MEDPLLGWLILAICLCIIWLWIFIYQPLGQGEETMSVWNYLKGFFVKVEPRVYFFTDGLEKIDNYVLGMRMPFLRNSAQFLLHQYLNKRLPGVGDIDSSWRIIGGTKMIKEIGGYILCQAGHEFKDYTAVDRSKWVTVQPLELEDTADEAQAKDPKPVAKPKKKAVKKAIRKTKVA